MLSSFVIAFFIIWMIRMAAAPRTKIDEINHLISLDEDNLMATRPASAAGGVIDFSINGDYLRCHYMHSDDGKNSQTAIFVVLSTKAVFHVDFEDETLTYFEFKESPVSFPEIYIERRCLDALSASQQFLAHRALATAQRIAANRLHEAQLA
jgi:hypothetical protein